MDFENIHGNLQNKDATEIIKIKKRLQTISNEIKTAKNSLLKERVLRNNELRKSIEERLKGLKAEERELTFKYDLFTAKPVNNIEIDIQNIYQLTKEKKKSGQETPVDTQDSFRGEIIGQNIIKNSQFRFIIEDGRSLTTTAKNILLCNDDTYIIETNTSYYRLRKVNGGDDNYKQNGNINDQESVQDEWLHMQKMWRKGERVKEVKLDQRKDKVTVIKQAEISKETGKIVPGELLQNIVADKGYPMWSLLEGKPFNVITGEDENHQPIGLSIPQVKEIRQISDKVYMFKTPRSLYVLNINPN